MNEANEMNENTTYIHAYIFLSIDSSKCYTLGLQNVIFLYNITYSSNKTTHVDGCNTAAVNSTGLKTA